jgi:hypothetical protein
MASSSIKNVAFFPKPARIQMTTQVNFLAKAISDGVDAALLAFPNAISPEEANALKSLGVEDLVKLLQVREAIEHGTEVEMTGNGILSF